LFSITILLHKQAYIHRLCTAVCKYNIKSPISNRQTRLLNLAVRRHRCALSFAVVVITDHFVSPIYLSAPWHVRIRPSDRMAKIKIRAIYCSSTGYSTHIACWCQIDTGLHIGSSQYFAARSSHYHYRLPYFSVLRSTDMYIASIAGDKDRPWIKTKRSIHRIPSNQ